MTSKMTPVRSAPSLLTKPLLPFIHSSHRHFMDASHVSAAELGSLEPDPHICNSEISQTCGLSLLTEFGTLAL